MSIVDDLRELYDLHARGGLTDEEFTRAKAALLDGGGGGREMQQQLDELRLETELTRLDREWERERESYMITGRYGYRHAPTPGLSIVPGVLVAGFGIILTVMASAMLGWVGRFSLLVPAFGMLFFLSGIGVSIFSFFKAVRYQQAHEDYQRRRASLLAGEERPSERSADLQDLPRPGPRDSFTR